jgi:hypothetical protein
MLTFAPQRLSTCGLISLKHKIFCDVAFRSTPSNRTLLKCRCMVKISIPYVRLLTLGFLTLDSNRLSETVMIYTNVDG